MNSIKVAMLLMLSEMAVSATTGNNYFLEEKEPPIPKGHTIFYVNGVKIYALNRKNALKKAEKLKRKSANG